MCESFIMFEKRVPIDMKICFELGIFITLADYCITLLIDVLIWRTAAAWAASVTFIKQHITAQVQVSPDYR